MDDNTAIYSSCPPGQMNENKPLDRMLSQLQADCYDKVIDMKTLAKYRKEAKKRRKAEKAARKKNRGK